MLEVRGIVPGAPLLALDLRDRLECTGLATPLDLSSATHIHKHTNSSSKSLASIHIKL